LESETLVARSFNSAFVVALSFIGLASLGLMIHVIKQVDSELLAASEIASSSFVGLGSSSDQNTSCEMAFPDSLDEQSDS
jgi:hypothetical protein